MSWDDYNINAGNYFSEITHMNALNALRLALIERAERVSIDVPERLQKEVVRMVDINWLADFENLLDSCIPHYVNFFLDIRPFFTELTLLTAIGDTERISPGRFLTFAWAWQRYKMINCLLICYYTLIANTHNNDNKLYLGNYTEGWYKVKYISGAYNTWGASQDQGGWNYASFDRYSPWNNNLFISSNAGNQRLNSFSEYNKEYTYNEAESLFSEKIELVNISGDSYFYIDDWTPSNVNNTGEVTIAIEGYGMSNIFDFTAHDSDGDGDPDWHELIVGTDPEDDTSVIDSDGDNYSDFSENLAGTDKNDSSDTPEAPAAQEDTISPDNPTPRPTPPQLYASFKVSTEGATATCINQSQGTISGYNWSSSASHSGSSKNFSCTFSEAGSYTITLTIEEAETGRTLSCSRNVSITQDDIDNIKKHPSKDTSNNRISVRIWFASSSYIKGDTMTVNIITYGTVTETKYRVTTPGGVTTEHIHSGSFNITASEIGTYRVTAIVAGPAGTASAYASAEIIDDQSKNGQGVIAIRTNDVTIIWENSEDSSFGITGKTQVECSSGINATILGHTLNILPLDWCDNIWSVKIDGEFIKYCTMGGFGSATVAAGTFTVKGWEGEAMEMQEFDKEEQAIDVINPDWLSQGTVVVSIPGGNCYNYRYYDGAWWHDESHILATRTGTYVKSDWDGGGFIIYCGDDRRIWCSGFGESIGSWYNNGSEWVGNCGIYEFNGNSASGSVTPWCKIWYNEFITYKDTSSTDDSNKFRAKVIWKKPG